LKEGNIDDTCRMDMKGFVETRMIVVTICLKRMLTVKDLGALGIFLAQNNGKSSSKIALNIPDMGAFYQVEDNS